MTIPKLVDIKNWSPEIEKKITDLWKKAEMFRFDPKKARKIYSIDTPPPYVNAPIHIGHAVTYSYMDFFARYRRMKGHDVLFPLGLDRNGLPIEVGAEKKYGISPFKVSREEFLKHCEKLLEESSIESADSFARLGISFTSYEEGKHVGAIYKTDSPEYRALTQATFIDLFKKGLVYEDKRISNWDPKLRTTIADSEIEYKEIPSTFVHVKWKIDGGKDVAIATTRPELIGTCSAVIFNPEDSRYKNLNGKKLIVPIYGRKVPIMAHPFAKIDKGTGLVMMCAGGDLTDVQFMRETKIEPIIAVNIDGTMNEKAGLLKGLKVRDARIKIIEELKSRDLVEKEEKIVHRTPVSERSGAELEFIEVLEFYLKQLEFRKEIKKIADKINFYPRESREILDKWIDSISIDWPISRRRFYATPIPLWHSEIGGKKITGVPKPGKYYEPWKEGSKLGDDADILDENGKILGNVGDNKFSKLKWTGETRVFDTWMDSSISDLFILNYRRDDTFFKKAFPASLRPQGKEIVRTWLYYTLLRGYLETKKPVFEDVWIHQHIVDEKGMKMSKSLGNVIDPQEIMRDFGGEALRFWSAIEGDLSKGDLKCSKERIKAEVKTLNKILNVSKFVMQFDKPKFKIDETTDTDRLFLDYINELTEECDKSYGKYDFYNSTIKLRNFLWEIFASHYVELVKGRAYNQEGNFSKKESESAKFTLYYLLERFLRLIYPIIPQITSTIALEMKIDLLKSEFPESEKVEHKNSDKIISKIMEFNKSVWKKKQESGISLREGISGVEIPKELEDYKKDLRVCHKI